MAAAAAAALVAMAADTPLFDERGRASERRTEQRALHCRSRLPVDGPSMGVDPKKAKLIFGRAMVISLVV